MRELGEFVENSLCKSTGGEDDPFLAADFLAMSLFVLGEIEAAGFCFFTGETRRIVLAEIGLDFDNFFNLLAGFF